MLLFLERNTIIFVKHGLGRNTCKVSLACWTSNLKTWVRFPTSQFLFRIHWSIQTEIHLRVVKNLRSITGQNPSKQCVCVLFSIMIMSFSCFSFVFFSSSLSWCFVTVSSLRLSLLLLCIYLSLFFLLLYTHTLSFCASTGFVRNSDSARPRPL